MIRVVDGDTIDVLTDAKETIRIRLHGIDCPERGQPFGNNATQALKASILGNVVKVVSHGQDRYDRTIGRTFVDLAKSLNKPYTQTRVALTRSCVYGLWDGRERCVWG
mgnify:CR=1 FL=1